MTGNCFYCKTPLFPGSRSRYCSSRCRQSAYRSRLINKRKSLFLNSFSLCNQISDFDLRSQLQLSLKNLFRGLGS